MTAVTFDTLKYAEALKTAGVPEAQAEAEALTEALRQGGQELATKAEIAELRMATRAELTELKNRAEGRHRQAPDRHRLDQRMFLPVLDVSLLKTVG
jgi:hypothetical protein